MGTPTRIDARLLDPWQQILLGGSGHQRRALGTGRALALSLPPINPEAINRATSVFVQITLVSRQERQLDAFEEAVLTCPDVMSCHLMSGEADYLLHLVCADVSHYERIHRTQLALLPGVARLG